MAALQERNGSFRIIFRYQGKQRSFTIGEVGRAEAEAKAGAVDLILLRLKQQLISIPPGVYVEEFLFCDGQVKKPKDAGASETTTFRRFKERYLETHQHGA